MAAEDALREGLQSAAARAYGDQRSAELAQRLGEIAHWLALVQQQPLDLLDEEPDSSSPIQWERLGEGTPRPLPRPSQRERAG